MLIALNFLSILLECTFTKIIKMVNDQLKLDKDNFENIAEAWKGDLWDRKRLGEQLTQYVDRLQCGAVLALDARWGEGKRGLLGIGLNI